MCRPLILALLGTVLAGPALAQAEPPFTPLPEAGGPAFAGTGTLSVGQEFDFGPGPSNVVALSLIGTVEAAGAGAEFARGRRLSFDTFVPLSGGGQPVTSIEGPIDPFGVREALTELTLGEGAPGAGDGFDLVDEARFFTFEEAEVYLRPGRIAVVLPLAPRGPGDPFDSFDRGEVFVDVLPDPDCPSLGTPAEFECDFLTTYRPPFDAYPGGAEPGSLFAQLLLDIRFDPTAPGLAPVMVEDQPLPGGGTIGDLFFVDQPFPLPTRTEDVVLDFDTGETVSVLFAEGSIPDVSFTVSVIGAEPAPIPLPGGLPLAAAGLGALGLSRMRMR